MKTQAIVVLKPNGPFSMQEVELEDGALRDDEVLVDMIASGICMDTLDKLFADLLGHTDVAVAANDIDRGFFPKVLGHEGSAKVRAVGKNVSKVQPGDNVLLSFSSCGECIPCTTKHPAHCMINPLLNFSGTRKDGSYTTKLDGKPICSSFFGQSSFSKVSIVNQSSIVKATHLSKQELALLAPLGCGLQTGSGCVFNILNLKPGSSIAIFGGGGVGLSAMFAAQIQKVKTIIVVDLNEGRLQLAKSLGATHTINPRHVKDVVAEIKKITDGYGVMGTVETTGVGKCEEDAVGSLAKLGTCGIIGGGSKAIFTLSGQALLRSGVKVVGVCQGDATPSEV